MTKTYYFPCNGFGRAVLNSIINKVGCSIGEIRKVADTIAVPITINQKDVTSVERILQTYDLL